MQENQEAFKGRWVPSAQQPVNREICPFPLLLSEQSSLEDALWGHLPKQHTKGRPGSHFRAVSPVTITCLFPWRVFSMTDVPMSLPSTKECTGPFLGFPGSVWEPFEFRLAQISTMVHFLSLPSRPSEVGSTYQAVHVQLEKHSSAAGP